jgi:putative nucleotidyltransferase with HDIG domain
MSMVPTGRAALARELQRSLARGTSDLPTLPRSVTEALRLARTPTVDFDEVARVAASDPPLSARVVSVANSALYARSGMPTVASVRTAAVRLGTQATRDVLFQVAYASMFVDVPRFSDLIESTFEHGARVGRFARALSRDFDLDGDMAFLAGLLHDFGRARCWKVLAQLRGGVDPVEATVAVDEAHTAAGAELAAAWRLPEEVCDGCLFHHHPGERPYPRLLAAADALARLDEVRDPPATTLRRLVEVGMTPARAEEVVRHGPG